MESVAFSLEMLAAELGISSPSLSALVIGIAVITVIALVLKGFALWHAARNYQRYWFIALLVINTLGILELVYLVWFRKDKREGATPSLFNTPAKEPSSAG